MLLLTADPFIWMADICLPFVWKAGTANRFLLLPKVRTELTTGGFGTGRLPCPRQTILTPMCTTCAWFSTKTAGFTEFFAPSEKIRQPRMVIPQWLLPAAALPAQKTWWSGRDFPILFLIMV